MVRSDHRRLLVIGLTFVLLVLMHNAATPVFEAPDEVWHYAYVRWIAEGHGLPALDSDESGASQQAAQPLLYYLLAALVVARSSTRISPPFLSTTLGSAIRRRGSQQITRIC